MHNSAFLGVKNCNYKDSKTVIFYVPYERTVSYGKGTSFGPDAIIKASEYVELYDEELKYETYKKARIHTYGNLSHKKEPEEMIESVRKFCNTIILDNKFPVMLGGEHSITTGLFRALNEKYDLSVVQFDAHTDLRGSYEGSKYNHACVMRRIYEDCKNIIPIGIRSMCVEEADFIKRNKIKVFYASEIIKNMPIKEILRLCKGDVFITMDVDCFDPSIIPSTGTPEPGGLDWYIVVRLLKEIFQSRNVVGFDIVELAPTKNMSCDFLAAKLLYRMLGYKFLL